MILTPMQWHQLTPTPMPVVSMMVPLLMSLASHGKEKPYCTSFQMSWPEECNGDIDDVVGMMWHWCQCWWHQITNKSCCTSFQLPLPKEYSGAIFYTFAIMWCQQQCQCCTLFWLSWLGECSGAFDDATGITWCWCHWHHLTKSHFASPCDHLDLKMEWCHWWCCWHHMTLTPTSVALYDPKVLLHIISVVLTQWIQWCYWQCHWHFMILMPVPSDKWLKK